MTKKILSEKQVIMKKFIESSIDDFGLFTSEIGGNNTIFEEKEIYTLNLIKKRIRQPTKNQHWVPQFYLNLFQNSGNLIEVLDLKNLRIGKPRSSKSICSEDYFYSMDGNPDLLSQLLEVTLGEIEDKFAKLYPELCEKILKDKHIDDSDLYGLCLFANSLHIRSKRYMEHLDSMMGDIFKELAIDLHKSNKTKSNSGNNPNTDPQAEKAFMEGNFKVESKDKLFFLEHILDEDNIYGFANLLFEQKIRFYIANGDRRFVTSDHPVFEMDPGIRDHFFGFSYLERLHYFVLSPSILVEFSNPFLPGKKVKRIRVGDDRVSYFNLLRSAFSSFLYSNDRENFNQKHYDDARVKFLDELYKLVPSAFQRDVDALHKLQEIAIIKGIKYSSYEELIEKLNPIR